MSHRPFSYLAGFEHRLAERRRREAVAPFVSPEPDQISVPFHEDVFRRSTPPAFVLVDFSIAGRDEPRDFLRQGGIGEVENTDAGVEVSDGHGLGAWSAGR